MIAKGCLYLIRNRDLYKIGVTKNLDKRMVQLKPDALIVKIYTNDFLKLERELHKRYKRFRIPQTEYFRLKNCHVKENKQIINRLNYPINITLEIFIKSFSILLLFFLLLVFRFSLTINDLTLAISRSLLWTQRISSCLAFYSIFKQSDKYFDYLNELKYRFSKFTIYIMFILFIRVISHFYI